MLEKNKITESKTKRNGHGASGIFFLYLIC